LPGLPAELAFTPPADRTCLNDEITHGFYDYYDYNSGDEWNLSDSHSDLSDSD
jgi:hypothetical protein